MFKKIREWFSIQSVKNPGRMVLFTILLFNVVFFFISAGIISALSINGTESMSFIEAFFYTIKMVLDAGFMSDVTEQIGNAGATITIVCLTIILIGMISFTGAVIGYVTNTISNFIENSNSGKRKLHIQDHIVILNWNTRASEIINDLLYCDEKKKVVVLVEARKEEIEKEIEERLADTISRENQALLKSLEGMPKAKRRAEYRKHQLKRNITVIVRQGDVFSSKQLSDISLERAKAVVILGNDINNTLCKFDHKEKLEKSGKGNAQTVKTLMQVADITSAEYSNDDQKVIVEITDDWTWALVDKIIKYKQVDGKCNIVPIRVNRVLGQILSQFSLMPELNLAYRELFSNKGATIFSLEQPKAESAEEFIAEYLSTHRHAIPLTQMEDKGENYGFYSVNKTENITKKSTINPATVKVKLNRNYWMERKNVVILGHNGKCEEIMQGFKAFGNEWNKDGEEIVRIVVVDEKANLEKMDYYRKYPFVIKTVTADIYDKELICSTIESFVDANEEDTSVLILSDDSALNEDLDSHVLANLVYVQDIINRKKLADPNFDEGKIDVVVELIDPKHHDIVNNYNVDNVVISNRYKSNMITQLSETEALFNFSTDILTYDEEGSSSYESKEIYVKKAHRFFDEIPAPCTAEQLIRAVYEASVAEELGEKKNPTLVLGYVKQSGEMVLFEGNQSKINVALEKGDKLVLFAPH